MSGAAPLVPRRIRRSAAALAVVCALALVALAARYSDTDTAGQLDVAIMSRIQDLVANHRQELWLIVRLGGPVPVFVMAVLLASVALATRRPRLAVLAFAGPGTTGVVTTLLKPLVGRTLEGVFALPSGHTGVATAISTVAALVVIGSVRTRLLTAAAVATAAVFAIGTVMGIALIANGLHYPTDVVAGFCTALAVVLGLALGLDSIAPRARRRSAGRHDPGAEPAADAGGPMKKQVNGGTTRPDYPNTGAADHSACKEVVPGTRRKETPGPDVGHAPGGGSPAGH